jgi:hypothetical protein
MSLSLTLKNIYGNHAVGGAINVLMLALWVWVLHPASPPLFIIGVALITLAALINLISFVSAQSVGLLPTVLVGIILAALAPSAVHAPSTHRSGSPSVVHNSIETPLPTR